MKLSAQEMLVAATVQLRRDETVVSAARRAGIRQHAFVYALKRLQQTGVLRPWVFVNPFQMGYEEVELLFTVGAAAQREQGAFRSFLENHPQVIWYGSLGGAYQYGIRIIVQGVTGCQRFLDELESRFRGLVMHKSLVHILSFTSLPKRYLATASSRKNVFAPEIEIKPQAEVPQLDGLDFRILHALLENPLSSDRELARVTTLARATIASRLQRLRKDGVLLGSVYLVSARTFGYHPYRILIYGRGLRRELSKKIMAYVKHEVSVVNVTHCLGAWDYELSIEVQDPAESASKVSALYEWCEGFVDRIELLPVFEQGISHRFLDVTSRGVSAGA